MGMERAGVFRCVLKVRADCSVYSAFKYGSICPNLKGFSTSVGLVYHHQMKSR